MVMLVSTFARFIFLASVYLIVEGGEFKLTRGYDRGDGVSSGSLLIRRNSGDSWGSVAVSSWGINEAKVVCRMLGYQYAQGRRSAYYGMSTRRIWTESVNCNGDETSLFDCRITWLGNSYNPNHHSRDVGVACWNESAIITVDDAFTESNSGTPLIWEDDIGWRPVCDDDWDDDDAGVFCRQKGFISGKALCCSKLTFFTTTPTDNFNNYPFYSYNNFHCTSNDTDIQSCNYTRMSGSCSNKRLASVICYNTSLEDVDNDFAIRLSNSFAGDVQVRRYGQWGLVANLTLSRSLRIVNVSCRSLGFTGGLLYKRNGVLKYKTGESFWASSVSCTGSESRLDQCGITWGEAVDRSTSPVEAVCYGTEPPRLELVNGTSTSGRVELIVNGVRGRICARDGTENYATTVCRQLGFQQGSPLPSAQFGQGDGPVFLETTDCLKSSIFECSYLYKWSESSGSCSVYSKDLTVSCRRDVILEGGSASIGIVTTFIGRNLYDVCGTNFNTVEAVVVCKHLGFNQGRVLLPGTFGSSSRPKYNRYFTCSGTETSLLNCPDRYHNCRDSINYAAVHCFNDVANTVSEKSLKLQTVGFVQNTGQVLINESGLQGSICANFFGKPEANVVCRQLGYGHGIALKLPLPTNEMYLIQDLTCFGNESNIFNCSTGTELCPAGARPAGVFCYNNQAPILRFKGGGSIGVLEIVDGTDVGNVCIPQRSTRTAITLCKMLGYKTGDMIGNEILANDPVFLDRVFCSGSEESVFQCSNSGWKSNHQYGCNTFPIKCERGVRLSKGGDTNVMAGRVEVYDNQDWKPICRGLDDRAGEVICRELASPYYKVLEERIFGSTYVRYGIDNVVCNGSELTLSECNYSSGQCSLGVSSLLCSKEPISTDVNTAEEGFNPSITIYNTVGSICSDGWDDNDASVFCRQSGFQYGRKIGVVKAFNSTFKPRLAVDFRCNGSELNLNECPFSSTGLLTCQSREKAANAICSNRSIEYQIRLKPGNHSANMGSVEFGFQGMWGSICVKERYKETYARMACQRLGYPTGSYSASSLYAVSDKIWLKGLKFCRELDDFGSCVMDEFNTTGSCGSGDTPILSVDCHISVELKPGPFVGSILLTHNQVTGLVCNDDFDSTAASVACKHLGFKYSHKLQYSPYNSTDPIMFNNFKCSGMENKLDDCSYDQQYCRSNRPAYVMCTNLHPNTVGYDIQIGSGSNDHYGKISINHLGIAGTICPNHWDDHDASVVCKEVGDDSYTGGFAYNRINLGGELGVKWLSDVDCSGNESYISQCPGLEWGNVSECNTRRSAAVYCSRNPGFNIRLTGSSSASQGRVEVLVNGVWGSVCELYPVDDEEASVICRMLNYSGGNVVPRGTYGYISGPIHISRMDCVGTEKSLLDCGLRFDDTEQCSNSVDLGIKCYSDIRLTGSTKSKLNYGRLEVLQDEVWRPVCDTNFNLSVAKEACQILGYTDGTYRCCSSIGSNMSFNAVTINSRSLPGGNGTRFLDNYFLTSGCQSNNYTTLICSERKHNVTAIDVSIQSNWYGTVIVNSNGVAGVICPTAWADSEANVVCKQRSFKGGIAGYGVNRQTFPVIYGNFNCSGNETGIDQCQRNDFNTGCSRPLTSTGLVGGVVCHRYRTAAPKISLSGERKGKVKFEIDFSTYRICSEGWDDKDATVLCRQLNYLRGEARSQSANILRFAKSWVNIACRGDEKSLYLCKSDGFYNSRCRDAGVECYNNVRLEQEVLEVHLNGQWGAVCGDGWTHENTVVVCRELNYNNGYVITGFGIRGRGAVMNQVRCSGNETTITACSYSLPYSDYCQTSIGLQCFNGNSSRDFSWSIEEGNRYTGYIAITFSGKVGKVCSDGWDDAGALVACKERGFTGGIAYSHSSTSLTSLPYWISNINCTGSEDQLSDCDYQIGDVTSCNSNQNAGILCTARTDIFYRLSGENGRGMIQVDINGQWGTLCTDNNIRTAEFYDVFCRSYGYVTGYLSTKRSTTQFHSTGPIYDTDFSCVGHEKELDQCPHSSWTTTTSCSSHETVHCVKDVQIMANSNLEKVSRGPVQIYYNYAWHLVCDDEFNDASAKRVCQDLSYQDGKAVCCSAFGVEDISDNIMVSDILLKCNGSEERSLECVRQATNCSSGLYASVVCFDQTDILQEYGQSDYNFTLVQTSATNVLQDSGKVSVSLFGIEGDICADTWDTKDAMVFCRSQGHEKGLSFPTRPTPGDQRPFWIGGINCTGSEMSLTDCPFRPRLQLGNCTSNKRAAVTCYNGSLDITYQFLNSSVYTDRSRNGVTGIVVVVINGVYGNICYRSWGVSEADVFCRQMGYDGGATDYSLYSADSIWLSDLKCQGTEENLGQCAHSGFAARTQETAVCERESLVARAFCYNSVRISTGGVEIYQRNLKQWLGICYDSFGIEESSMICRERGFRYGGPRPGAQYEPRIGIEKLSCDNMNDTFSDCRQVIGASCSTRTYASVKCSRIKPESGIRFTMLEDGVQGRILGVFVNGVQGSVYADGLGDMEVKVACRINGSAGGVLYRAPSRWPVLLYDVKCVGNETSLQECQYNSTRAINNTRPGLLSSAGIMCFNGTGIEYRLNGNGVDGIGRFEMSYDGRWGHVCLAKSTEYGINRAVGVMCRQVGYVDGIVLGSNVLSFRDENEDTLPFWVHDLKCTGDESSVLDCSHATHPHGYCSQHVILQCFNQSLAITGLRLSGIGLPSFGRVEVYQQGPNKWGSVCDKYFDDREANVICRQLGYYSGKSVKNGGLGVGQGPIWLSGMSCQGTESNIYDCDNLEYSTNTCTHSNDAGVICTGKAITTTTSSTVSSSEIGNISTLKTTTQDTKTAIPDTKTTALDTKTATPDTKTTSLDTKTATPDTKTTSLDTKTASPDTKTTTRDTTTTTPPLDANSDEQTGISDQNVTIIVGSVLGGVLFIMIIVIAVCRCRKSNQRLTDDKVIYNLSEM